MHSRDSNVDPERVRMCHWVVGLIKINTLIMGTPIFTVARNNFPCIITVTLLNTRLVPDQDVQFFYMRSHLRALQSCALTFSKKISLFSHLNSALYYLIIELCSALKTILFFFSIMKIPFFIAQESSQYLGSFLIRT